jgi:hypothetical protein
MKDLCESVCFNAYITTVIEDEVSSINSATAPAKGTQRPKEDIMSIQHLHMNMKQFSKLESTTTLQPQLEWLRGVRNRALWVESRDLVKALVDQAITRGSLNELQRIAFEAIQICIKSKRPDEKLYWVHWLINTPRSWAIVYRTSSSTRIITSELIDSTCPQFVIDMCKRLSTR